MSDAPLPRIVAGYAYPLCPTCDKQFGPEVADVGPVQCDACGKWFEVVTQTVYQAEQMLDYEGGKPDAAPKPRKQPARSKTSAKRAK